MYMDYFEMFYISKFKETEYILLYYNNYYYIYRYSVN